MKRGGVRLNMGRGGIDDNWAEGRAYEDYMGRWSQFVGNAFIDWLAEPPDSRWLDVGCGTGVLTQVALDHGLAGRVVGVDRSENMLAYARSKEPHPAVTVRRGTGEALPLGDSSFDVGVCGLSLVFFPDAKGCLTDMRRIVCPGGTVAAYVWDYAGEMQMLRRFWDAAIALDPAAKDQDEGKRFPLASPGPLTDLFSSVGLEDVETHEIEIPTIFEDFDDYWTPFLSGVGPSQVYCMSLDEDARAALCDRLEETLQPDTDGRIHLTARAWAVRGTVPEPAAAA